MPRQHINKAKVAGLAPANNFFLQRIMRQQRMSTTINHAVGNTKEADAAMVSVLICNGVHVYVYWRTFEQKWTPSRSLTSQPQNYLQLAGLMGETATNTMESTNIPAEISALRARLQAAEARLSIMAEKSFRSLEERLNSIREEVSFIS